MPDLTPLRLLLLSFAGWVNRNQARAIAYLREENRILEEQLGGRRLRLTTTSGDDSLRSARPWAARCWHRSQRS